MNIYLWAKQSLSITTCVHRHSHCVAVGLVFASLQGGETGLKCDFKLYRIIFHSILGRLKSNKITDHDNIYIM